MGLPRNWNLNRKTALLAKGKKLALPLLLLLFNFLHSNAQDSPAIKKSGINTPKLIVVGTAHAAFWVGTYVALDKAWYRDYPKTDFHFFNDNSEWNQMDKMGHMWTSYNISRISQRTWKWAGINQKTSVWMGGMSALAYQSIIEIQDAYSEQWGFSWGDMVANGIGVGSFIAQELGWKEQRIMFKMSYHPGDYPDELQQRVDQLYGPSWTEKILKDYNSQTHWISFNIHSFFKESKIPKWLNLAVGYGAEGMYGGFENKWEDESGTEILRKDIPRIRQFYLAADIDLTRIKTKSKFLRSVFYLVNCIKVPAPTIMFDSQGKFKAYVLYF